MCASAEPGHSTGSGSSTPTERRSPAASSAPSPAVTPAEQLAAALNLAAATASTSASASAQLAVSAAANLAAASSVSLAAHPNLFVRGLPLAWSEAEIAAVFGQHGTLTSIRLVRHSLTKHSMGYGFVRFGSVAEAHAAIAALDGNSVLGNTLQVKFADADAGPPSSAIPSGLTPGDSIYCKHLPSTFGVQEVQRLFEPHGAVLDVKLFPCLDQYRGASALIRMASVEAAERAITALNNTTPPGAVQTLIVRFAESAAEKAARLSRREKAAQQAQPAAAAAQQQQQQVALVGAGAAGVPLMGGSPPGLSPMDSGSLTANMVLLPEQQLQQTLSALGLNGSVHAAAAAAAAAAGLRQALPPAPLVPQPYHPAVQSSVCIKGMPGNADRLWLYENFARFGAIAGLRILVDESTGLCNGTGFVNFADGGSAEKARAAMNGMRAGDKILHVMVQQQQRPGGSSAAAAAAAAAVVAAGGQAGASALGAGMAPPSVQMPAAVLQQPGPLVFQAATAAPLCDWQAPVLPVPGTTAMW